MGHITHMPRKHPSLRFFGTDCQVEKIAHQAIEQQRLNTENELLRRECASLRRHIAEQMQALHASATNETLLLARLQKVDKQLTQLLETNAEQQQHIADIEALNDRLEDDLKTLRGPSALDSHREERYA